MRSGPLRLTAATRPAQPEGEHRLLAAFRLLLGEEFQETLTKTAPKPVASRQRVQSQWCHLSQSPRRPIPPPRSPHRVRLSSGHCWRAILVRMWAWARLSPTLTHTPPRLAHGVRLVRRAVGRARALPPLAPSLPIFRTRWLFRFHKLQTHPPGCPRLPDLSPALPGTPPFFGTRPHLICLVFVGPRVTEPGRGMT